MRAANVLKRISSAGPAELPVRRALLSVSDKTGIEELAAALSARGVELLSTGGTASAIRNAGIEVVDVSSLTDFPEILGGRVKTLHPAIHGGLLAVKGDEAHEADLEAQGISPIDLVVMNLYPFEQAVAERGDDLATCIENIDIGGPAMMRAAAKNHGSVAVLTSPSQYSAVLDELEAADALSQATRRSLAAAAFATSAAYDCSVSEYMSAALSGAEGEEKEQQAASALPVPRVVARATAEALPLKYGCNPHQKPAFISSRLGGLGPRCTSAPAAATVPPRALPFEVLSGNPGYINLLDAMNAWQLVAEGHEATGLPCAASFKHVSPAGVGVAVPLSGEEREVFGASAAATDSACATAYVRARNADPLCSFGDFAAISDVVDEATARVLRGAVSDGVIAPGYTPEALAILKKKKKGAFIVLQADREYEPPADEYREVFGVGFVQARNRRAVVPSDLSKLVTGESLPETAQRDMLLAMVAAKYTQSNSVVFAKDGQAIGIGAGQQSRVDCVKLAARKARTWWLRRHPQVVGLPFLDSVKKQARVNARVAYIDGFSTAEERGVWEAQFSAEPAELTSASAAAFMEELDGVALASDAFFPFRDSLDVASSVGVKYVAQPGGSVQDEAVTVAAAEYGMTMAHTGMRLFHH